jgi:hypothetical protein
MPELHAESEIDCGLSELVAWHGRPDVYTRLTPPGATVAFLGPPRPSDAPALAQWGPLRFPWTSRRRDGRPGQGSIDEQVRGPFRRWLHTTTCESIGDRRSRLRDFVRYDLPSISLIRAAPRSRIQAAMRRLFVWRHLRTRQDLERHAQFATERRMRVLVGGASGLIGSALVPYLRTAGHEVVRLVRRPNGEADEIVWDPQRGQVDPRRLENFDAVVHMGGINIADGRWTRARKRRIAESRTGSTSLLSRSLAGLLSRPRVFVCASAIGYYGHRGNALLTEEDAPGAGFLSDTAIAWERATEPAGAAGIRTVSLRTGMVLASSGGALKSMLPAFRCGLGGLLGSGNQQLSWIALDDLLGLIEFVLHRDVINGPVNATAPHPVTQRRFAETLGLVLGRPTKLNVPSRAIRLALGEMGEALLLRGQRVLPIVAARSGFRFLRPTLPDALRWELGRPDDAMAKGVSVEQVGIRAKGA